MKLKSTLQGLMIKLPNNLTKKVGTSTLLTKKHSPAILFGVGVVGFGTTVFLACRATLKVEPLLEETQKKVQVLESDDTITDKAKKHEIRVIRTAMGIDGVKLFAPAVLAGVTSVCALTGSHVILSKRNVALTAAYAGVEKVLDEYRKRVAEEFGEEKEREIRSGVVDREIVEETEEGPVVKRVKGRGKPLSPYARCFEESNRNWQKTEGYNQMFLSSQQVHANNLLGSRGYVFLNEVLKSLGMKTCKEGQLVGWLQNGNGDRFIDFGIYRGNEYMGQEFVNGNEKSVWLDFNVEGNILDKVTFTE